MMIQKIKYLFRTYYLDKKYSTAEIYYIILLFVFVFFIYFAIRGVPNPNYKSSICIFKNLTGYPCPGCGTTRGVKYLLHGYFEKAILMNPLSYSTVLLAIITPIWIIKDFIKKQETFIKFTKVKIPNFMIIIIIILTILNWAWNIYKGL